MAMAAGVVNWVPSSAHRYTRDLKQRFNGKSIPIAAAFPKNKDNESSSSPMVAKKKSKRRLITISTSDGRWNGKWESEYLFSLRDLGLNNELPDDTENKTQVNVSLCMEKHTGLGLSVEGRIRTSFTTRCCNCCSPFVREIDAPFKVWVLASTRQIKDPPCNHLPTMGEDDPSVILVRPGYDADLDPVIQDTTRLAISVNETCSESCEKSDPGLHCLGKKNVASMDTRWSKLLELKKNGFFSDR